MISAQIDKLRQVAQVYRNLGKHATEQMLLDAADTIWELRDDLQRANSSLQDAEHDDESVAWDRVRKAEAESANLRELAKALLRCHVEDTDTCAKCSYRSPLHGGCMADVNADELGVVL